MSNFHNKDKCHEEHYHQKQDCHKKPHKPDGLVEIKTKVPVILAEEKLEVSVDSIIKFPEPVLEIKEIKKRVKLTQCRLLLPSNKLFVKGYIRKNIQYASPSKEIKEVTENTISSDLHSLTVDIPFQYVTEVKHYLSPPVLPILNDAEEFDFHISKKLPSGYPEKDKLLSSDLSQYHQISEQYYNELPYAELLSSHIIEWDEAIDREKFTGVSPIGEGIFTEIEEKMVVTIVVRILQEQTISMNQKTIEY